MQRHMAMVFFNKYNLYKKLSLQKELRYKNSCITPGCQIDPTDRGQPGRFEKWYKLPEKAKRLFWRIRKNRIK